MGTGEGRQSSKLMLRKPVQNKEEKIGRYAVSYLLKRAGQILENKSKGSIVFDEVAEKEFPKFDVSELQIGELLGEGGFCNVHEIVKVNLKDDNPANVESGLSYVENEEDIEDICRSTSFVQDRNFIAKRCLRKRPDSKHDARYAIKTLGKNSLSDPHRFVAACIDLAFESRFLAVIRHPNIIKMRAVATTAPSQAGFFIVLDRLYDTLTERLDQWKSKSKRLSGFSSMVLDLKGSKKKSLWIDRVMVGLDIAGALDCIHSMNVIYRDLKPDNIGFDVRGDVKIFDFGLAKELNAVDRVGDVYKLSGNTGSLRYMAPEVALKKPYNNKVDVYSFGILLWQILSLDIPFEHHNVLQHSKLVVKNGVRPKIPSSWPTQIRELLDICWHVEYNRRPEFTDVIEILRDYVSARYRNNTLLVDVSNKTANSLLG